MKEQNVCIQENNRSGIRGKYLNFGKVLENIFFGILLIVVTLLVLSLVSAKISGGPPQVAGHYMYIVLSGSMKPAFDTGSLVFVKPTVPEEIKRGDIITYKGLGEGEQLISHRVVEISNTENGIQFATKGDANEALDPNPISEKRLVGRVVFAIPYLGYFLKFTQTRQGIITIISIPAVLILLFEISNLYKYIKEDRNQKAVQCKSQREDMKP